jgi:hypothetical protein
VVGTIAQCVALTCFGNAFLRGHKVESFLKKNSTCQFCEVVDFKRVQKGFFKREKCITIANNPDEWFTYLKSSKAQGVRLYNCPHKDSVSDRMLSDRMSAGFVGGGQNWLIEAVFSNNQSEYWIAQWRTGDKNSPEKRIWKVAYFNVICDPEPVLNLLDIDIHIDKLRKCILDVKESSERYCDNGFILFFNEALDTIESHGDNTYGYHKDLSPKEILPQKALMLLNSCQRAWVFGGMGSWNDMMFENDLQKEYEEVSDKLFIAVNDAITAAANTSYRQQC